eukprot:s985_g25.t3
MESAPPAHLASPGRRRGAGGPTYDELAEHRPVLHRKLGHQRSPSATMALHQHAPEGCHRLTESVGDRMLSTRTEWRWMTRRRVSRQVKSSKWPTALLLLRRISSLHLLPDLFSFNVAIHGCEVGGAWVAALQLLEEIAGMILQPDLVSINSCISACSEGLRWAAAVHLFGHMADRQVQPDLVSYNAAMSAVGRGQLWHTALQLLQALPCKPNMISFNTAMAACERGRHWKHVIALLEKLGDNKMTPDMRTWTSLVASFSRASDWVKAQSILKEIRLQDLHPDLMIFGATATAFQRGHQWMLALSLLPETHKLQIVPDERLCGSVVTACAASQAWQAALSCLMEFPKRNLQPTSTSSSPVLIALLDVQQWLMALHLFDRLQHVVAMDSQAYGRLLLVCEQHRLTDWQHRLLQSLASPRGPARHTPGRERLAAAVAAQSAGLDMVPQVSKESAPAPASIPRSHSWTPYVKDIRLMEHILRNAERSNPHSVCNEVESFGRHTSLFVPICGVGSARRAFLLPHVRTCFVQP